MGNGHGKSNVEHNVNSKGDRKITKQLRSRIKNQQAYELVFLGAGESGKTTIIKQAIMNYGSGINGNMRMEYRRHIARNLVKGAFHVASNAKRLGHKIEDPKVLTSCKNIAHLAETQVNELDDDIVADLRTLFADPNIQATLQQSAEFQLDDTWEDFMKKLDGYPNIFGGSEYVPTDDDILRTRVMTIGFSIVDVEINNTRFRLIDVGGQRSQRKKWMNELFRNISGACFVTSLSEYNQTLFEDNSVNRLCESLHLFSKSVMHPLFANAPFMLFFNKFDLFQKKYFHEKVPLIKPISSLPDPPSVEEEKDDSCEVALLWFQTIFAHQIPKGGRPLNEIFCHVTSALDPQNITYVLTSCRKFVVTRMVASAGLIGLPSTEEMNSMKYRTFKESERGN